MQFNWTAHHLAKEKIVTFFTSRSSGSSYLNRVELQNGCLNLGHPHLKDPEIGVADSTKLKENLDVAIDTCISGIDERSCGNTTVQLYKSSKDSA